MLLVSLLSAIVHDYDHRGVNNDFLIRTGDSLALLYNDHSPQENHHLAAAFSLLKNDELDFLSKVPKQVGMLCCAVLCLAVHPNEMR